MYTHTHTYTHTYLHIVDEDIVPTTATNTVVHSKWELVDYGQGSSSDSDNEDNKKTNM